MCINKSIACYNSCLVVMRCARLAVISVLVTAGWCLEELQFPPGFKFGAASSSYQVEGGWNESDKAASVWDVFTHTNPSVVVDGSTGDVACDSYRLWRRDIEMAAELGLDFYRFSISWPRLLPNGFSNFISKDGKSYYNNLIDGLLEKGIEPIITIYHWDLPRNLQDLGGWTNPLIAEWFADYARVVYTLFGDRVKTWITINEPIVICDLAYNGGNFPPEVIAPDNANYICNKNLLIAHAKAWRIYDQDFRPKFGGMVSIANNLLWVEPFSEAEKELTNLAMDYSLGRFSDPIYSKQGGWPASIEALIAENSAAEGHPRSRLPAFTQEEIELIRGTYDFFGLNHYTCRQIRKALPGEHVGSWPLQGIPELGVITQNDPNWLYGYSEIFTIYPEAMRKLLKHVKQRYGNISVIITESGYGDFKEGLHDDDRVDYLRRYLEQVLLAIKEDGVNVTGYTAWTLMDNFEWSDGYRPKFGLFEVDFSDPQRTRTPRKSAHYYANVIKTSNLEP